MKIIGITGGIGSGKSTIAKMFADLGAPVYEADSRAKSLMANNEEVKQALIQAFGHKAFINGKLNRAYLANIVFNDKTALKQINAIVHPAVHRDFDDWVNQQSFKYVIQENALIFEQANQDQFDHIITVTAPKEIRVARVMARDQVNRVDVLARINNQLSDKEKVSKSDFVIVNTSLEISKKTVQDIHLQLIRD